MKQKVNTFIAFTNNTLIPYLEKKVISFQAGQISKFCREFEKLTIDPDNLAMVSGTQILFNGMYPVQHQFPPNSLPHAEVDQIEDAVQELLDKQVIVPCVPDPIEFVSPIFTTPKKDGNIRLTNSSKMTIRLTEEKIAKLSALITNTLSSADRVKIRTVAQVIGHMVTSFPAVEFGPLHYRCLDKDKSTALSAHRGNFEASMSISEQGKAELNWWLTSLKNAAKNILLTPFDTVLYSDASKTGWEASLGQ